MDQTAQTMQDKTPKSFEIDLVEKKYPTSYQESLNTVIKQECLRYNNLIAVMNSSLKEFRRALKGLVVMSTDLNALGNEMFNNVVPEKWGSQAFITGVLQNYARKYQTPIDIVGVNLSICDSVK